MPIVNLAREVMQERWADKLRMCTLRRDGRLREFSSRRPLGGARLRHQRRSRTECLHLVHLMPVGTATAFVIAYSAIAPSNQLAVGSGYIFWTAMNWAGLLEERGWAVP